MVGSNGSIEPPIPPGAGRRQGIGARSNRFPRKDGSAAGVAALKTDRKTSPDTVLLPVLPTSVTLMSRRETPRLERSRPLIVPTFVRESVAKNALSWALV